MTIAELDISIIIPALLAGILVLSTHVPLGEEVLRRGIIFIDLAIAQIAALGVIAATVLGGDLHGWQVQLFAAFSAVAGALIIHQLEKQYGQILEALIGLLFILSASAGLLIVSHSPQSDELLHDLLVGQILWVDYQQLLWVAMLYVPILFSLFLLNYQQRSILFYILFALAITASVQLVGIYLVFASLILPALASRRITRPIQRFSIAYLIGLTGYIFGLLASFIFDVPAGAITVWTLLVMVLAAKPILNRTKIKTLIE